MDSLNVIIANLNSAIIGNSNILAIKTLNGEFSKEDIINELNSLFYNKVIIDITAIKNYYDYNYLFDFLSFFPKEKIILFLSNNELSNSKEFISKLVESGYYNFTKNIEGVNYLINNPNTLKDVEKYLIPNTFQSPVFNQTSEVINTNTNTETVKNDKQTIIGIQNLTEHAGATTLMYMLIKQLSYNYNVQGIEMMEQDHIYFRLDNITTSTSLDDLKMKLKLMKDKEIIIVDLNDVNGEEVCDKILYLVEPGIIKLNKLIKSKINLNEIMAKGKIILNRSAIKDEELSNFEYETRLKVFYNLINFNDRKERIQTIDKLINKLGFGDKKSSKLFGIFN